MRPNAAIDGTMETAPLVESSEAIFSEMEDQKAVKDKMNRKEKWDISFLVLAFSCVVANLTMIVGTGAVVIISVGGSNALAPFALAVFFMGMSFVSLTLTHWMFSRWGRKIGFWIGCLISLGGALLGCYGLSESSSGLILTAQALLGGGTGIGMYLRYSAVEVVRQEFASRAVTWVLAGGCLAAFAGPEISAATQGLLGDENWTYLGTFIVAGCFSLVQAMFLTLVDFPKPSGTGSIQRKKVDPLKGVERACEDTVPRTQQSVVSVSDTIHLSSVLSQSSFLLPLGAAALSWAIMAMPMSIFRVPMRELGYSDRQSLTVIEFHFLAMYSPGFWSGSFIKKHGPIRACQIAIVSFIIAIGINLSVQDNNTTIGAWFMGLLFLGIGWNFGFSSATVWSTECYSNMMHLKPKVQAANEAGMFFLSGGAIFSTGYLYENAGGGGLEGWRLLNYTILSFVALFIALLVVAWSNLIDERGAKESGKVINTAPLEEDDNSIISC